MSINVHSQVLTLLAKLHQNTMGNALRWKAPDENTVTIGLEHGTVAIASRDEDGTVPLVVRILDGDGKTIEAFETSDGWAESGGDFVNIQEIFDTARRSATGVSNKLDALIRDLTPRADDDIPF